MTHRRGRSGALARGMQVAMRVGTAVSLAAFLSTSLLRTATVRAAEPLSFATQIRPLLESRCLSCHGTEKQEGGLRLDSLAAARAGGERGPAVVPGDVAASWLMRAVTSDDPDLQMPPKQPLSRRERELLQRWVETGADWPADVAVLFEDDPAILAALTNGNGQVRRITSGAYAGGAALSVTPLQRDNPRLPGWQFAIREHPGPGEYRFLRLAWRKEGGGSVMLELAAQGQWPDAKVPRGRYVAGPNSTGWAAISVADAAPSEWTVATLDLWRDLGATTITGMAPTCDGGTEAFFDSILLGPSVAALDAYQPTAAAGPDLASVGDAFTDPRNPIRRRFGGERLDLWSLRPLQEAVPSPSVTGSSPDRHQQTWVDALLARNAPATASPPAPLADRRTLARRLSYDLTGLPPHPETVAEFAADTSPDACQRLVDRLLASPRYGERQAQSWLDVVRYADTNGYERDEFRPRMWQYRDYVVRSLNQDKPFDQFLREQLAGDELVDGPPRSPAEADMLIATGYLRLGQWDSTASIFQEEPRLRAEILADLTNTTASAFLGLTMSCCQCHDHKYDPFSQADHFRLRAFFAGVVPRDDLSISLAHEQAEIDEHNRRLDQQAAPLRDEEKKLGTTRPQRVQQIQEQLKQLDAQRREPLRAMGAADGGNTAPATHLFYQGDFLSPREEVVPGFVSVFTPGPATITPPRSNTTGRRLALAQWIAAPQNPWTTRVLVNRLWQRHFGVGIVATPNDFGHTGASPADPLLLDMLAREFITSGWSQKSLQRLLVTSTVYQQRDRTADEIAMLTPAAGPAADAGASSPHPSLPPSRIRRLDAEAIRDSLLAVSGLLHLTAGGPPRWPPVPEELLKAQPAILEAEKGGDGGRMQGWYADPIEQTDVRSIYLVKKRCLPVPFLQAFDLPDATVSCGRRDATVVAPQALLLLNSPEGVRCAQALADRLLSEAHLTDPKPASGKQADEPLVEAAFAAVLQRRPALEEAAATCEFLRRQRTSYSMQSPAAATRQALRDVCRALLNSNEFAYLD